MVKNRAKNKPNGEKRQVAKPLNSNFSDLEYVDKTSPSDFNQESSCEENGKTPTGSLSSLQHDMETNMAAINAADITSPMSSSYIEENCPVLPKSTMNLSTFGDSLRVGETSSRLSFHDNSEKDKSDTYEYYSNNPFKQPGY